MLMEQPLLFDIDIKLSPLLNICQITIYILISVCHRFLFKATLFKRKLFENYVVECRGGKCQRNDSKIRRGYSRVT